MSPQAYAFDVREFFPRRIMDMITDVRVDAPEIIEQEALGRRMRRKLTVDGKLTLLACDHPARGVTHSGSDPLIMGNRQEYLGRMLRIIVDPGFDGIMAPPDLMEDLFIVDYLIKQGGGPSFLDTRVLVGCMQRGGVAGVVGEIDDRFGAYSPEQIEAQRLDAGKMMFRFVADDERTLLTIDYCANAVTELYRRGLVSFLEPLPQVLVDGKYKGNSSVPVLVKMVNVAGALGESSALTWLKIPYVDNYEQVALSTTLPILMLGGESTGEPVPLMRNFARGMRAGANVRGVLVGRNILFPGADDPLAPALAINRVIHQGLDGDAAAEGMGGDRGRDLDMLTKWIR